MNSTNRVRKLIGTLLKTGAVTVVLATLVGAVPLRAAFADNDDRRGQAQHQDRDRHDNGERRWREPPRPSRYHRYPVYAPPPVHYYPRDESPGIRFIFPIDIR